MNKIPQEILEDDSADKAHHPSKETPDKTKTIKKLRNYALYLLARRDHSEFELKQKIESKGYLPEDTENILTRLKETGLIDDERFAENYISYRSRRGHGPNKLRMELKVKGVADSIIAQLVEITDNAWFSEALNVWRKQFKGVLPTDAKERAKQTRYLYNRGYTQDQISQVFKHNDEDNE